MNEREIRIFAIIVLIAGLLAIVAGILFTPTFVANNLSADGVLASETIKKVQVVRLSAILIGAVAFIFGVLSFKWPTLYKKLTNLITRRSVIAGAIVLLLVLWLPNVLIGHSGKINGERYWFLRDDAMISMRYAQNLANGNGLVYNPGKRVEGYTNFLWTLYMAGLHLLPVPIPKLSLLVLLTSIILAAGGIPILAKLVEELGGDILAVTFALTGYVLSSNLMAWTTSGLETPLITFVLLLATYKVIKDSQDGQPGFFTYILIGIMPLIRADAVFLSALLYAISLLLSENKQLVLVYCGVSLLLPLANELFKIFYYGNILPNTYYLKGTKWGGKYLFGLTYTGKFLVRYIILILFAFIGSIFSDRTSRRYLLSIFLFHVAYVTYVGGDPFDNFRFFVPILPIILALAGLGLQDLGRFFKSLKRNRRMFAIIVLIAGLLAIVAGILFTPTFVANNLSADGVLASETIKKVQVVRLSAILIGAVAFIFGVLSFKWPTLYKKLTNLVMRRNSLVALLVGVIIIVSIPLIYFNAGLYPRYRSSHLGNIRIALLLKKNTPPDSKVATFYAGIPIYFSQRRAVDLLGFTDPHIAHLPAVNDKRPPGHNKFDFDYSLGVKEPDFIVGLRLPDDKPVNKSKMQRSKSSGSFVGHLYFNPLFQKHCLPNRISMGTWQNIFVCDWSSQLQNKNNWEKLSG